MMKKLFLAIIVITGLPFLTPGQEQKRPIIELRSEPLAVSEEEALQVFGLTTEGNFWVPQAHIDNQYEDQGEVVYDQATGLMWQKSGSDGHLEYADAQKYIETLNRERFSGYNDWRLPTIPELLSLVEPDKQPNMFYIDPIFDVRPQTCWSADEKLSDTVQKVMWIVGFAFGEVSVNQVNFKSYVRAVRSVQ